MKRKRSSSCSGPGYPDSKAFLRGVGMSMGAGVITVVAFSAAVPACGGDVAGLDTGSTAREYDSDTDAAGRDSDSDIVGDTNPPAESYPVSLPDRGSRALVFPHGAGTIAYHLAVILDGWGTVDWLEDHVEEALQAIDGVLLQHQLSELPVGAGAEAIEAEIKEAIELLYIASEGVSTEDVLEVALIIDENQPGG